MEDSFGEMSHPILSCPQAAAWEEELLQTEEEAWEAMLRVGSQLSRAIGSDYGMTRYPQRGLTALGLIGKGHNGGDALLALRELAADEGRLGSVTLVLSSPLAELKPNTRRAFERLEKATSVTTLAPREKGDDAWLENARRLLREGRFDLCLDGLLGMQFRPPLRENAAALLRCVNESTGIRFRVAVDLPSGVGEESDADAFRADVCYATGIFKRPLLDNEKAGVLRYLDIGFFEKEKESEYGVVTDRILDPLRGFRAASSEKRRFGHLAILAGSRSMPGALAMSVRAALRSGVGLVTVLAPESMAPHLATSMPEAMWRQWPETPEGGLALEGLWQARAVAEKADALLLGPGMGTGEETQALLCEIGRVWDKPALLDADALRPAVVDAFLQAGNDRLILTPHDGEFWRLSGQEDCSDAAALAYAREKGICLVKKGSATRVSDGRKLWVNTTGNGVLARGGSGDLLAGLTAGLLAACPDEAAEAACRGVYWHGKAADLLARACGQTAVHTLEVLDFLSPALQSGDLWNLSSPASRPTGS